ncbi:MAG TPA: hypothetical protein VFI13_02190 [Gemmatimonadales bacterium]|nr:hypothetical protein [Gemmatimonadales bacterium]
MRFPITFDHWFSLLARPILLDPEGAFVDVGAETIEVRMGWAFRVVIPRSAVRSAAPLERKPLSRGVHGWNGRWLVNGSGEGLLGLTLEPTQCACVMGVPVRLRELWVSVQDPLAVAEQIKA